MHRKPRRLKIFAIGIAVLLTIGTVVRTIFISYATPLIRTSTDNPIYTVGDSSYAVALSHGKGIVKFGRLPLGIYQGGLAFESPEAAATYLGQSGHSSDGWGVYELSGDLEKDTYVDNDQRFLNVSLSVVRAITDEQKMPD